jgi:hypothetical protein
VPVPTAQDQALSVINDMAASVQVKLTTMRYSGETERDISGLREMLQEYVDQVMAFAHAIDR